MSPQDPESKEDDRDLSFEISTADAASEQG